MSALHAPQPIHPSRTPSVQRLRSPISLLPMPSCSSPSRRRTRPAPRRRRPTLRTDRGPHIFDQLPWISALESAPENANPWDIADLSLIPDPENITPISSTGPVRQRKTSLRLNPMGPSSATSSPPDSPEPLTPCDTNSPSFPCPATPSSASAFAPSRVLFRNLMPVCDDSHPSCTTIQTPPTLDSSPHIF